MALDVAYISEDVYFSMFNLALYNDKLEVLGILVGETKEEGGSKSVHVYTMVIPLRLTSKHDRVEASPEQLLEAATEAEKLSAHYNRTLRVIGWFHSHPHITVWPSDVDLKTQQAMQTMDECFVGIIASVFSCDKKSKENQITLTCFQTEVTNYSYHRTTVSLHIVPDIDKTFSNAHLKLSARLPTILLEEETLKCKKNSNNDATNLLTNQFNSSVFTMSAVQIQEMLSKPLSKALEMRRKVRRREIRKLIMEHTNNNEEAMETKQDE